MSHNPAWLINKHPKNLKAQMRELIEQGYTVTLQDASSAQLVKKKGFSCLFAIITGVIPYALYYMWKQDGTVYLDLETQKPDPNWKEKIAAKNKLFWIIILSFFGFIFLVIAIGGMVAPSAENPDTASTDPQVELGL